MKYYDLQGKVKIIDETNFKTKGGTANIFLIDDNFNEKMILKNYFSNIPKWSRINPEIFNILKNINHTNFLQLYDYFKKTLILGNLKATTNPNILVEGYTYKYLEESKINILLEDKEYLLENIRKLRELFNIFSELKIETNDVSISNVIMNNESIIIIDPDNFKINESLGQENGEYKTSLRSHNINSLYILLQEIFLRSSIYLKKPISFKEINEFLGLQDNFSNLEDTLSKKLQFVKKPIDYFH